MNPRSTPASHIWTAEVVENIIKTEAKVVNCRAQGNYRAAVHEGLICHFSPYYAAALRGGFSEANTETITFDLSRLQAKTLLTWLYQGTTISLDVPTSDLIDLYIFADITDIVALRRAIMTYLHKHREGKAPRVQDATKAFDMLSAYSGLVRWFIDQYCGHWMVLGTGVWPKPSPIQIAIREAHKDLHEQICCWHAPQKKTHISACNYHEHESKQEWKKCAGEAFHIVDTCYLKGHDVHWRPFDDIFDGRWARYLWNPRFNKYYWFYNYDFYALSILDMHD